MATTPPKDDGPVIGVQTYVADARHAIQVAGLLADQPDLREAELTRPEWDAALAAYNASLRP